MNRNFWTAIRAQGYRLPAGADLAALTDELLTMLGSPDGELRDDIAYATLATWVSEGRYDSQALLAMGEHMASSLTVGLGAQASDSVFLRAFSVLILGEIVALDAREPGLPADRVRAWAAEAARYLRLERDERGFVPGRGWAHAAAHTADCLGAVALHPATDAALLRSILAATAERVLRPQGQVFIYEEDERLAFACLALLRRPEIQEADIVAWCDSFLHPTEGGDWRAASAGESGARAYLNVKSFLRSLYLQMLWTQNPPPLREDALQSVLVTIRAIGTSLYGQ